MPHRAKSDRQFTSKEDALEALHMLASEMKQMTLRARLEDWNYYTIATELLNGYERATQIAGFFTRQAVIEQLSQTDETKLTQVIANLPDDVRADLLKI